VPGCSVQVSDAAVASVQVSAVGNARSQKMRPFAADTVVPESAAVTNIFALLTTAMLVAELSADAPPRIIFVDALMAELAFKLAAASTTIWLASAKLLAELSAAAPLSCRVPAAAKLLAALSAELAGVILIGAAIMLPVDVSATAARRVAVASELTDELAVRLAVAGLVTLEAALMAELAVRVADPAKPSVAADSFEPRLARLAAPC